MPMPADHAHRILCVDDEPNLLAGLSRQLRGKYEVITAESGEEALSIIEKSEPFAVVISDMRMPRMNGANFLSRVRQISNNSMRILLTGQADLDSAIHAVNDGQIYRFLIKPCPPQIFLNIVDTATEQYRIIAAEKQLLESTLHSSIKVLIEILSLLNPVAFSQSTRIQSYINHLSSKLNVQDKWQFEIASMLSQIGCITVPQEILTKVASNLPLDADESLIYQAHSRVSFDLIRKIPRLETIAAMVRNQRNPNSLPAKLDAEVDREVLGGNMLRIALDVDRRVSMGDNLHSAINTLAKNTQLYHTELINLLSDFKETKINEVYKAVYVRDLTTSMKIDENIQTTGGTVVVSKGHEVSEVTLARLRALSDNNQIREPFRVIVRQ